MRNPDQARHGRKSFIQPARAALFSALLAAAPVFAASAQPAGDPSTTGGSSMAPHGSQAGTAADTIDQRIATLHEQLKITSAEESDWKAVAETMRDNAHAMEQLASEKQSTSTSMTAVEDLQTYSAFAQAHVDHLKKLTSVFETLYKAMPAQQKKLADQVFAHAHRDSQGAEQNRQG